MRKKQYRWYRHPRTTAEARANQDGFSRAKRRKSNLPNAYDDIAIRSSNSWKDKRKTQYRVDGRGKEYTKTITSSWKYSPIVWHLKEYFRKNDIPFRLKINNIYKWVEVTEEWRTVETKEKTVQVSVICGKLVHTWAPKYIRKLVPIEPKMVYKLDHTEHVFTWWSHKDVGIEFLMQSLQTRGYRW